MDIVFVASTDSHSSCETDQAAPGPALPLSSTPVPTGFHLSDSAILLHSWPGNGYHGSLSLGPSSAKHGCSSLMLSLPVWGVECSPSRSVTPHSQTEPERVGAGEGSTLGITLKRRLTGYLSVFLFTVQTSWNHVLSSLGPSFAPAPLQCLAEFLTHMGT